MMKGERLTKEMKRYFGILMFFIHWCIILFEENHWRMPLEWRL